MKTLTYFQQIPLSNEQHNALEKLSEFLEGQDSIFILQGYAGTGKTTLIKGLTSYLNSIGKNFEVMAPTGRAAKVLREKTGYGATIHSAIYNLKDMVAINSDSDDEADHSIRYSFPIDLNQTKERIIIVDEASMVSNKESKNELFDFGTNILLDDLLTYSFSTNKSNKIIFVGDPAQLPPVGDNNSWALNQKYFESLNYSCVSCELTEVKRQENNLILKNATALRKVLKETSRTELSFEFDNQSFLKLNTKEVINKYLELYPNPEIGDGVIIAFSNAQCYHYNMGVRESLFPNQKDIIPGDIIIINNNNYHTYDTELFNGDMAKVVNVSNSIISHSAPVWTKEGGESVKKTITIDFRKITIRVPDYDGDIDCYIIDSLLNSIDRDLSTEEIKALYINFVMRFRDEQEKRVKLGLNSYKVGSLEFKTALKEDPFYNALKVKYGYAITCHKAQGGEWNKVIVDYSGRVGLYDDALRWCYTATTRGINQVYALNTPYFTLFSKLKFSPVATIGKIPNNAINFDETTISPFHNPQQHKCKSLKYWDVRQKLEKTDFRIINIESKGDFLEYYTLRNSDNVTVCLQASHKGSGHFIDPFKVVNPSSSPMEKELEDIFNSNNTNLNFNYLPGNPRLENLYSVMQEQCATLGISITNIVEQIPQYFVTYFLITDSVCSYIQFYFNKDFRLSTALPKSFQCSDDGKLLKLINNLKDYAS